MTLQKKCLKIIMDEFHIYYSMFSKSSDTNFKRKFEFLQRVYSYEIIIYLVENDRMKAEYIDFLVNKYLKTLNDLWFKDCCWNTIAAKFAEIGSNIQKIYLSLEHDCNGAYIPWKDVIHYLTNLQEFSFPYGCTDEILKCVAIFCPNILEIDVRESNITIDGIKYLCKIDNGKPLCTKLKKVLVGFSQEDEEKIKYIIQHLKSLEETDFGNLPEILYSIHKKDMSSLSKIEPYNLTTLNLLSLHSVPHYNDLLKLCMYVCPLLKSFSCSILNKEHLDLFLSSPLELQKLHLESVSAANIDVTDLLRKKGQKLISLNVRSCALSVAVLAESCPCLKELFLNHIFFKDDSVFTSFNCLETCDFIFMDSEAAKSVILLLRNSPKLEYIGFKVCNMSSSELRIEILRCCEHCPIKKVNFECSAVNTEFIKDILLNCHSLKSLQLDTISYGDKKELYRFAEVLPNSPAIEFLDEFSLSEDSEDEIGSSYGFDIDFDDNDYTDYHDYYQYDSHEDFY